MQELPVCFGCETRIEGDIVFEAPCGHDEHISGAFHPICLMEWRERREQSIKKLHQMLSEMEGVPVCPDCGEPIE